MCGPFAVCHMPHVEALKLIIYSSGQSVPWDQRAIAYPLFLNQKQNSCHALVRYLVLHEPSVLVTFLGFWL